MFHLMMQQKGRYSAEYGSTLKTYLRISLIFWYLWACIRNKAIPWNYFQMNSIFFNKAKGIFSKLEMDALIPKRWRLEQIYYDPRHPPDRYPVFIKPEWGQNSNGITCVYSKNEYRAFKNIADHTDMPFIVQETAPGKKEFEIYYLRSPDYDDQYAFLSITEVPNTCLQIHPINSIHNSCTRYVEVTRSFTKKELETIWLYLKDIGKFRMARVGVKADTIKDLIKGKFHIVEINLFLPMPLILLAENVNLCEKKKIIKTTMSLAARLVKKIPENETGEKIFFQKIKAHYKVT